MDCLFDKYTQHKFGEITSPDLVSWKDVSDNLIMPKGIRHGSVFSILKKEFEKLAGENK